MVGDSCAPRPAKTAGIPNGRPLSESTAAPKVITLAKPSDRR